MNDIASKLRKAAAWMWNQKEKMFLAVLLIVLMFRAYVVLINPPDVTALTTSEVAPGTAPKTAATPAKAGGLRSASAAEPAKPVAKGPAPKAPITADNVPLPEPKPVLERAEDFKPLVRQNPFTIYGVMAGTGKKGETEQESIDLTLNRILKWRDGTYRAEMTSKVTGRPKYYKEGEPFESYKLMSIDAVNNSVTVFSSAHDKTFTLLVTGN